MNNILKDLKQKVKNLKKDIIIVYLAYFDRRVNWFKKAFLLLIIFYIVSPIDLIPDFIPVLGLLDDVILVPIAISVAIKMIPKEVWKECKEKALDGYNIDKKYKIVGLILILSVWAIVLKWVLKFIIKSF